MSAVKRAVLTSPRLQAGDAAAALPVDEVEGVVDALLAHNV